MTGSPTCPGCSGALSSALNHRTIKQHPATELRECLGCGGLIGRVYRSDLADHVILEFHLVAKDGPYAQEDLRYFDLDIVDDNKALPQRVHGWYLPRSRRVVQFG